MKKNYILIISVFMFSIAFTQVKNVGDTTFVDIIDFEAPCNALYIDTSASNIWQIGIPSQQFLDSAYSPTRGIMTDTINNYPVDNYSWFDITLIKNYMEPVFLHFYLGISIRHKFDTDSLKDGGFLSISYDHGQTFTNVIEDYSSPIGMTPEEWGPFGYNEIYDFDDTLFNGNYGFSGKSGGWITSNFSWYNLLLKDSKYYGDTVIIRFNFISDNINNNKEGWLIDDIRFYWVDTGGNITTMQDGEYPYIFPNPVKEYFSANDNIKSIEILNNKGHTILKTKKHKNIDISNQPDGIYFVRIKTDESIIIKKLIKQ